jgi:hypothetical protein
MRGVLILTGCVCLGAIGLKASGDQVRWDFSGTLDHISGTGSSQPGAVPGAIFTGYATADIGSVYLGSRYTSGSSLYSVYDFTSGKSLTYTLSVGGSSYTYNVGLSEAVSIIGPDSDGFELGIRNGEWAVGRLCGYRHGFGPFRQYDLGQTLISFTDHHSCS